MVVTPAAFHQSLAQSAPPSNLSDALQALWWAGKDDWERAHKIVMESSGEASAWVHAYLHRVEGDLGNADYWYRSAGKPAAADALETEWQRIATALLTDSKS
ncbi:MAG: hypothetical protein ACR2K5_09800 [Pseudolabrys sp.]